MKFLQLMQHLLCLKNNIFMMKKDLLIVVCLLSTFVSHAQFVQYGATLEYKGNEKKTLYTDIVSIAFDGAANVANSNGHFHLNFNSRRAGDMVGKYNIKIGNGNFVLFNKKELNRWVLTKDAKMEILVCNKTRIDEIVNSYTKTFVNRLKASFINTKNELEKLKEINKGNERKIRELNTQLESLRVNYDREVSIIKANAISFAYVDETKLDSLELLKRHYMLIGEIDSAINIGRNQKYFSVANNLININNQLAKELQNSEEKIFTLIRSVAEHIDNLKCSYDSDDWKYERKDSLKKEISFNEETIINLYEYLIAYYTSLPAHIKCDESFIETLKKECGIYLYDYISYADSKTIDTTDYLRKASAYNNCYALFDLADREDDFFKARQLFEKCYELTVDSILKDKAEEMIESFPDFFYISPQGDTLYCHILDDKNVSLCDFHSRQFEEYIDEIRLPSVVKNHGKKYRIKKIGYGAMRNCCICRWDNNPLAHNPYGSDHFSYTRSFGKIIIPESVEVIGRDAFLFQWGLHELELPKSLRIIKDNAFEECVIDNLVIPEGVECVGEYSFWNPYVPGYNHVTLSLPSTLKKISDNSFIPDYLADIKLAPDNKNFTLFKNALYNNDKTKLYTNLICNNTASLYIPDNYKYEDIALYPSDNLVEYIVSNTHPLYSVYKGVLYSKDYKKVIAIPEVIDTLYIHPNINIYNYQGEDRIGVWPSAHNSDYLDNNTLRDTINVVLDSKTINEKKYSFYIYALSDNIYEDNRKARFFDNQSNLVDKDYAYKMAIEYLDSTIDSTLLARTLLKATNKKGIPLYIKQLEILTKRYNDPKWWQELGEQYLMISQITAALICFDNAKLSSKEQSGLLNEYGCRYLDIDHPIIQKDTLYAFALYEKAIQLSNNPYAATNIALIYKIKGDIVKAKEWYSKAIEWNVPSSIPYMFYGNLYWNEQNYLDAYKYYVKAASFNDADAQRYIGIIYMDGLALKKDINNAIEWFEKSIKNGDKTYSPYYLGYLYKRDFGDNIKSTKYYKISADKGKFPGAMNEMAYAYAYGYGCKYNLDSAFYYINNAIKNEPGNLAFYDTKGELYLLNGDLENAKKMWTEILNIDEGFAKQKTVFSQAIEQSTTCDIYIKMIEFGDSLHSPYNLALEYLEAKKFKEAMNYLVIASNNANIYAFTILGQMYLMKLVDENIERGKAFDIAIEYFRKAIEYGYDGKHLILSYDRKYLDFYTIAEIAYINGKYTVALNAYKESLALNGNNITLNSHSAFQIGYMYLTGKGVKKNIKKAIEYFQTTISCHEDNYNIALANLGICYYLLDNYEFAAKYICEAINNGNTNIIPSIKDLPKIKNRIAYVIKPNENKNLSEFYLLNIKKSWNITNTTSPYDAISNSDEQQSFIGLVDDKICNFTMKKDEFNVKAKVVSEKLYNTIVDHYNKWLKGN